MRFDLVAHLARPGAVELVRRAVDALTAKGHACTLRIPEGVGSADAPPDLAVLVAPLEQDGAAEPEDCRVISFGGDGTFLRAARLARSVDAPIIGVNVGRVGFLAEIDPEGLDAALDAVAADRLTIEERSTLDLEVLDHHGVLLGSGWALNDVAVEKEARQRLIRLEVAIGGTPFASIAADAVIVATSTGSTAYALSAGGPIVNPTLDAMLIAPVAPHSLFDRTVVTDLSDTVTIRVADDQDPALVSTDGMDPVLLGPGGQAVIRGGARPVRVARVGPGDFFARVRRTFRLG
jgi:NAD+ kinase